MPGRVSRCQKACRSYGDGRHLPRRHARLANISGSGLPFSGLADFWCCEQLVAGGLCIFKAAIVKRIVRVVNFDGPRPFWRWYRAEHAGIELVEDRVHVSRIVRDLPPSRDPATE